MPGAHVYVYPDSMYAVRVTPWSLGEREKSVRSSSSAVATALTPSVTGTSDTFNLLHFLIGPAAPRKGGDSPLIALPRFWLRGSRGPPRGPWPWAPRLGFKLDDDVRI